MSIAHNTQTAAAPAQQSTSSMLSELQVVTDQITFAAYNNAPISTTYINQLIDVSTQMTAGPPLNELNDVIAQLSWAQTNNAPVSVQLISELNDVYSQLSHGTETTNPPDVAAIAQLSAAIISQEPDWAPLLWVNVDPTSTILSVYVDGIYTLTMTISEVPWWTHWPTFYEAASQLIATIYLMQMAGPTVGFDQAYSSPDITVSADILTPVRAAQTFPVTAGAGVPPQTSLSSLSKIGQVYAEVQMHKLEPNDNGVGISNSAQDLTTAYQSWLGSAGSNSIGYYDNGQIYLNNALIATVGGYADLDVIGVALDCIAQTVQFRNVTQNGSWSATYNISALGAAPYRLGITIYNVGESGTANFAGPFIGTPLSGFGTWI